MRKVLAFCSLFVLCALCLLFLGQRGATAQDSGKKAPVPAQSETVAKPKTQKQIKKDEEKLKKELETPYKKWLNEEVTYIISDEERKAFGRLNTDEERENFIEQFWLRRDPTPDTEENEYREEHYRRIAYANETFASGVPGWKTDRGMIYIKYGAPDQRTEHNGGFYERPIEEGGGETSTFPFEQWRYRYLDGLGTDINIEFVDTTMTGEFHMTADPSEKDALLYVPGAGLTMYEQMGLICKQCRFTRTDGTHLGTGSLSLPASMDQFTRLEQYSNLEKPPVTRFTDLESIITTSVKYNLLPMLVRADFIPLTESTVLTNVTVQFDRKDFQYRDKQGISSASVEVTGRITTVTRKFVTSFDEMVQPDPVPTEYLEQAAHGPNIFQKTMHLKPGLYKLIVIAKDVNSSNTATREIKLDVPRLDDDRLATSSLILADLMEPVEKHSIGIADSFVIGNNKVRPRMEGPDGRPNFKRDEYVKIYLQLYNFEPEMVTTPEGVTKLSEKKADGVVKYEIVKDVPGAAPQAVAAFDEEVSDIIKQNHGAPAEVLVEKQVNLKGFDPGQYTLKMTVVDRKRNQTVTQSAPFTVN